MPFRRNVFILGAGFSAEAGAPVISNFFERAMELYKNPKSGLAGAERAIFGQVFEYRDSLRVAEHKVRIDPENIEDLFGLAEMAVQVGEQDAEEIRRSLVYVILRTIELTSTAAPQNQHTFFVGTERGGGTAPTLLGDMYDLFVDIAARRWEPLPESKVAQDVVITLNYDLLLEKAIAASPSDGNISVGRRRVLGSLAPLYDLPAERLEEPTEIQTNALCRLRVLKLHGSANWAWCQSCNRIKILMPRSSSVTEAPPRCSCGRPMNRLIVPPAWNKEEYLPLLRSVWRSAFKALSEAQRIWIIGYSMPASDKFFQYLLALSQHRNKHLDQVVVVNSNADDASRIAALFRAHHERHKVLIQQEAVSSYMKDQRFQRQLGQYFQHADLAW